MFGGILPLSLKFNIVQNLQDPVGLSLASEKRDFLRVGHFFRHIGFAS